VRRLRSAPSALVLAAFAACAPAQAADAERGRTLYESRCIACHSIEHDRVGPRHRGLIGRKAGGVPGFEYSSALRVSKIVWSAKTLDAWLADPERLIPGQRMNYSVPEAADRADLISYLIRQTSASAPKLSVSRSPSIR
jgi:cytochrome c